MTISIGMAHYEDFHGAVFTIQSILAYQNLYDVAEILVIDASPGSAHSRELKSFCDKVQLVPVRFIEYHGPNSTTQPRQAIFDNAIGDWVLVLDCHVLLQPNFLDRAYSVTHQASYRDAMLTGPIYYDGLKWGSTHFDMVWRGQMWGIWATAWATADGQVFSVHPDQDGNCVFFEVGSSLEMKRIEVGFDIPDRIPYAGHERAFSRFVPRIRPLITSWNRLPNQVDVNPFKVPAQGLGMFLSRRESWPGFNRDFREFGGEEGYIHAKYLARGDATYCVPGLGWWHRFGRPEGARYRFTMEGKVRNYVIGFQELGRDIEPIRQHFMAEGLPNEKWQQIVADPVGYVPPAGPPTAPSGRPVNHPQPSHVFDIPGVLDFLRANPRDLNEHFDAIIHHAKGCKKAVELAKRRESVFPLVVAGCEVTSYNEEQDAIQDYAERYGAARVIPWDHNHPRQPEACDFLFLDTRANGERLGEELKDWGPVVSRCIAIHDTQANGEIGDDGKGGMWDAMKAFLLDNPDWFVAHHGPSQWGLTILSKVDEFRPKSTIIPWPPGFGPGTEMFRMLEALGVTERPGCSCKAVALQMDYWGPAICKQPEPYAWILKNVKENSEKWTWAEKLQIGAKATLKREGWALAFRLNPLRLEESLIDEAIRRAEEKDCETECLSGCKGTCDRS
jgi:hypothetical protein